MARRRVDRLTGPVFTWQLHLKFLQSRRRPRSNGVSKMSLVALRFRCRDRLLNFGLQIANVEAGSGLHRRVLDEAGDMLCDDLPRNLEAPHLVLKRVVIADGSSFEPFL